MYEPNDLVSVSPYDQSRYDAQKRLREDVEGDLVKIMGKSVSDELEDPRDAFLRRYDECTTLKRRLSRLVGAHGSLTPAQQVRIALNEAVQHLKASDTRKQAAAILLGLDLAEIKLDQDLPAWNKPGEASASTGKLHVPRRASTRMDWVQQLYQHRKDARTNRQTLQRTEIPEIREALVDGLLELERAFTRARRSDIVTRRRSRNSKDVAEPVGWDQYEAWIHKLVKDIREFTRRPLEEEQEDWSTWAIVAIGRGGMPLATHLSHQLGISMVGFAGAWQYVPPSGEERTVIDALYTPPQDYQGCPQKFLVVDDVVASGDLMAKVIAELRSRYAPHPIEIYQVSLLRDTGRAKEGTGVFFAERFNSHDDEKNGVKAQWYDLPWEKNATTQNSANPTSTQ